MSFFGEDLCAVIYYIVFNEGYDGNTIEKRIEEEMKNGFHRECLKNVDDVTKWCKSYKTSNTFVNKCIEFWESKPTHRKGYKMLA